MRSLAFALPLALLGCAAERDDLSPIEPGAVTRGNVRCSADEGGNLHVRAPADAKVTQRPGSDPAVEVEYAAADANAYAYQMPRPQRPMSRSLGFIGDAPLTQQPNHGGRFSYGAHDDILGPHRHTAAQEWSHGPPPPYGYGSRYGYGPRW